MQKEIGVRKGSRIVPSRPLSILMVVLVSALLLACSPAEDKPSARTTAPEEATVSKAANLLSSDALTRDCQRGQGSSDLGVGEVAVNFTLKDTYGSEYSLSALLAEKPVVMVFGSFT
jgi:cytochrome oxidase Cu insertion factor (SCO1/SenC/PrrC family)